MTACASLCSRIKDVMEEIKEAEASAGRKEGSVKLLPVSKTFPVEKLKEAWDCGVRRFGENYVQEACDKFDWFKENVPDSGVEWHLIGPLQSNKTRPVAERFDWVQTVDRAKIADRLSAQRPEGMKPLNVLIEVHISNEESKSGVEPEEVRVLADHIKKLPNLKLRGLMAIPAPAETEEDKLRPFLQMKKLFDDMNDEGYQLDTLSMGMSGDFPEAITADATMVRVGSAIFGHRHYPNKENNQQ